MLVEGRIIVEGAELSEEIGITGLRYLCSCYEKSDSWLMFFCTKLTDFCCFIRINTSGAVKNDIYKSCFFEIQTMDSHHRRIL